jgi:hypothetical protein
MLINIAIFSCVIFLTLSTATVFAQENEEVEVDFPFAYTQSVVRNSDGQLIVYQENYSPRLSNVQIFNQFLDQQIQQGDAELTILDTGQENLEMIQFQTTEVFESEQLRAWDNLLGKINDEFYNLAIIFHEGYPVSKGDVLTITWTFMRQNV